MKKPTLHTVTGTDILESYEKLHDETFGTPFERDDFISSFNSWVESLRLAISLRTSMTISLNKKSYLGKKTRALLDAIGWKEPKTLGLLIEKLWKEIPEAELESRDEIKRKINKLSY
jgi:hypothetical protein